MEATTVAVYTQSAEERFVTVATQKQIKANQENARKSTGPITATGKEASSRNAVSHGLTAERHFIDGEDPAQFAQLRTALFNHWQPVTAVEIYLVDFIAMLMWRRKRIPAFEAVVISALAEPQDITAAVTRPGTKAKGGQAAASSERTFSPRLTIAQAVEAAFNKNFFDKITRYEAGLVNQLRRAISDLHELINERAQNTIAAALAKKDQAPPPPVANATEAFSRIRLG